MKISVWFSWAAGTGVLTAGNVLWEMLAQKWYLVVWDKQYESIIKWWNNLFVLYISDQKNYISKQIDYLFAYDQYAVDKNSSVYHLGEIHMIEKSQANRQNTFSIAACIKLLGLDLDEVKALFEKKFKWEVLEKNLNDLDAGYAFVQESKFQLGKIGDAKMWMSGNEAIAEGAVDSELEYYAAYPMTPASSIINYVVKHKKVVFFQWEDEIAVSMSMLGAHFAGKRAMCGTSWGWFALMTESISYANIAELWWVYILSQRAGPSTGTPTFNEQWDIEFALHSSFGGTHPIVLCPKNLESAYNLIGKALNRSDIYQHPVVFLVDKSFSETAFAVDKDDLDAEAVDRWDRVLEIDKDAEWFARYRVTETGVSPYSVPGVAGGEFIASSYEHDIFGATSEDPMVKKYMTQKRHKKINETFVQEVFSKWFQWFEVVNPKAKKFLVTLGSNYLAINSFLDTNPERWAIYIEMLQPVWPYLKQFFVDNFGSIEKLVFVEQNYSGQFEKHIRVECGMMTGEWELKIGNFRKYGLYPIFEEEILV